MSSELGQSGRPRATPPGAEAEGHFQRPQQGQIRGVGGEDQPGLSCPGIARLVARHTGWRKDVTLNARIRPIRQRGRRRNRLARRVVTPRTGHGEGQHANTPRRNIPHHRKQEKVWRAITRRRPRRMKRRKPRAIKQQPELRTAAPRRQGVFIPSSPPESPAPATAPTGRVASQTATSRTP